MKRAHSIIVILIVVACIPIIAGIYIALNPQSAADITDNYIRPIIGDSAVIRLEKLFYNSADIADQITKKQSTAPSFGSLPISKYTNVRTALNTSPLPPLPSLPVMQNEGVWNDFPLTQFPNQNVMSTTFIRPDADRAYAVTSVVQLDMKALQLQTVAGLKEPGKTFNKFGIGRVPQSVLNTNTLVATFDGGFLYNDGQYGMIADGITYAPLKQNTATLVGYTDGTLKIVNYTGQDFGPNVAFVRQNCPILLENGNLSVLDDKNKALWGRTLSSGTYTWRSGIGITKEGNLIYIAGNNLTPATLAYALKTAGSVDAMQLDINPAWMSFDIYSRDAQGTYTATPLTKDFRNRGKQFLRGYNKDFFYLTKK